MAASLTTKDLRAMTLPDLEREIRGMQQQLLRQRLGIRLRKQKETAGYRRQKKLLAVMLTVATEKRRKALSKPASPSTVSRP